MTQTNKLDPFLWVFNSIFSNILITWIEEWVQFEEPLHFDGRLVEKKSNPISAAASNGIAFERHSVGKFAPPKPAGRDE